MKKRFLSILLSLCMVLVLVPVTAFAEDNEEPTETPVCTCEAVCVAEAMNADCPICGAEGATAENCGKYEAPVEETEPEQTAVDKVQALINALPDADTITEENRADVEAQLTAIDEAKLPLGDELDALDFSKYNLDFTKYDAAIAALNELDNMGVANVPIIVGTGAGDFTVIGGTIDVDYSYNDNILKILTGTPLTISGTTTTDRIVVQKDISANITLAGVEIDVSSDYNGCAFEIENDSNGEVIITVADNTTNRLKSGFKRAGLEKEGIKGSLKIQCERSAQNGHICTETCGKLRASSTTGSGIGSGASFENSGAVSNITITGGIVTASSTSGGGIGSGRGNGSSGAVSNITITGGIVTASSTSGGGTGSGYAPALSGDVNNITITGGIVTASSTSRDGIGSGKCEGSSGAVNNITIAGGSVKASSIGCSPTNGSAEVYLCTIENSNCEGVIIDDEVYKPYNHTAIDSTDTKLYAYLTGRNHTVQIGSSTYTYTFDSNTNTFSLGTSSMVTHGNDYVISAKNSGETLEYIKDYTYQNGVLTINSAKAVTICMNDGVTTTTDKIVVAENVDANIMLTGDVIMGGAMQVKGTALIYVDGHTLVNKAGSNVSDSNTITFKNGDDIYAYEVISGNNKSYEINKPSKGGYEFDSWYNGNTKYVLGNTLSSSVTLEAQWTAKGGYNISFDTDGGTVVASKTNVKWTDKVLEGVTNPTKDGYKFDGWYYGKQSVTVATKYEDLAFNETVISIRLTAQWKDNLAPTGEIKISNNSWKSFLNNITFGLFFKDTQNVTITAKDNSGETVKIEYLLSDKELTENDLETAIFTDYSEFNITPDNEYIIYAKLTDSSGNVAYINSNGIVLDATLPIISGIENNKTYCSAQTVTVSDKYEVTVTVNDEPVTLINGQFTLSPVNGTQTVVAKDQAGNVSAEMIVTVNDGHEGGTATCTKKAVCKHCGLEYGEVDNSNHDLEHNKENAATVTTTGNKEYWHCKDCKNNFSDKDGKNVIDLKDTVISKLAPEIIGGKGQSLTAGEKKELTFRSNAAYSDFIRVEVDGKTVDGKNYTAKEGSTIVTLKADYVATLSAGEHTLGIVSESGTATTTFTVNAKVANDNTSPATGDNSHMALWFALLFVSGGLLTVTGVCGKKKKYSVK